MAYLLRTLGSAAQTAGLAAASVVAAGLVGLALNWTMLLLVVRRGGALSFGLLVVVFGIAFPIAWLLAAQPYAVSTGLRSLYRRHKDEVLNAIAGALREEAAGQQETDPERWMRALDGLRAHLDRYPRPVRPLLRMALRRAGVESIAAAIAGGSGPVPLRIAAAVADRIEQDLAGSGALWLWVVMGGNLLAYLLVFLLGGS